MLMRETRFRTGFRSVVPMGPLTEAPPRYLRAQIEESRQTAGESADNATLASYCVPGIGRVLQLTGDGFMRLFYCDRIPVRA